MSDKPTTFSIAATINGAHRPYQTLLLDKGDWEVKPIQGDFTAWSAWNQTTGCATPTSCKTGWLTAYRIWSPDFTKLKDSVLIVDSKRCESESVALADSKPTRFQLSRIVMVSFYIDDSYNDNRGGLTLSLRQI